MINLWHDKHVQTCQKMSTGHADELNLSTFQPQSSAIDSVDRVAACSHTSCVFSIAMNNDRFDHPSMQSRSIMEPRQESGILTFCRNPESSQNDMGFTLSAARGGPCVFAVRERKA